MNTFNTESFTQKVVADLGRVASGLTGQINLIPALPGMGIIGTLQEGSRQLAQQGVVSSLVNLDVLSGPLPTINARGSMEYLQVDTDVKLLIIDGSSMHWTPENGQILADFVSDKSQDTSVWVVGGDIDALSQMLPENLTTRFSVVHRSRINVENGNEPAATPTAKPKA